MQDENKRLQELRLGLIDEEFTELKDALDDNDIVEVADAISDLLYVVLGTAISYGIPIDKVFEEVHRSNLSKLDANGKPIRREDGKILKGPNFFEPQPGIIRILREHGGKL